MKNNPIISICMPSNRGLSASQASIESVLTYATLRENTEFCISDNSNDPSKAEKYLPLVNENFKYSVSPDLTEPQNWFNALSISEGDYVSNIGDDDYLLSTGKQMEYILDKNIIGYRPNIVVWDKKQGVIRATNYGITGNTAKERIANYFKLAQGNNNTLYSFIKKDSMVNIFELIANHPISKSGYYDWAITLGYVSSGNLLPDPSSLYIYDNHNWSGTAEDIQLAIKNLFIKGGQNERGILFLNILLAIDSYIIIARRSSEINFDERMDAAEYAFMTYAQSFLNNYLANTNLYSKKEIEAIKNFQSLSSISDLVIESIKVIGSYNEELLIPYLEFLKASIDKK